MIVLGVFIRFDGLVMGVCSSEACAIPSSGHDMLLLLARGEMQHACTGQMCRIYCYIIKITSYAAVI